MNYRRRRPATSYGSGNNRPKQPEAKGMKKAEFAAAQEPTARAGESGHIETLRARHHSREEGY